MLDLVNLQRTALIGLLGTFALHLTHFHAFARVTIGNPTHPGWYYEYLRPTENFVYLRFDHDDGFTEIVPSSTEPDYFIYNRFRGRQSIMSNQSCKGKDAWPLLFGGKKWGDASEPTEPMAVIDTIEGGFLILEFIPTGAERNGELFDPDFNNAVTYLKLLNQPSSEENDALINKLKGDLNLKVHECEGDTARLTIHPKISLQPVDPAVVEKALADHPIFMDSLRLSAMAKDSDESTHPGPWIIGALALIVAVASIYDRIKRGRSSAG